MTEQEKQEIRLTNKVPDRLRMYGWEIRRGRCRGFCHNGHDFNMVVSDYSAYCYVCNQSFDIFDIVKHFENCTFSEAVDKLSSPLSYGDRLRIRRIQRERLKRQREQNEYDKKYWHLWSKWILVDTIIRFANPYSKLYSDAIHKREYLNYLMEVEL